MFLTSTASTGDIGGLAGADQICEARATAGNLGGGPWVAWLSTSTIGAVDRLAPGAGPFVHAVSGVTIAHNVEDLTDGTICNPIRWDEFGGSWVGYAWTGSFADGTVSGYTCDDWNEESHSEYGTWGFVHETDQSWTHHDYTNCAFGVMQLYCFEIPALTDEMLSDGFESGDTSAWDGVVGWYAGHLECNQAAAAQGSYGLQVTVGGTCTATDDLIITSPATIEGEFTACNSITASDVQVGGTGATFAAGKIISLGEDFSVASGSPFGAHEDAGLANGLAYVQDDTEIKTDSYGSRFDVRLDDLTIAAADMVEIFSAYSSSGDVQFKAVLKYNSTLMENRLVLSVRQDDGSYVSTTAGEETLLPPGWNTLDFRWEAGMGTGLLTASINCSPPVGLSGLDNDQQQIDRVRLGYVGGTVTATSGSMDMDNFFSYE